MGECRNKCGNEAVGRSMYCGATCKVAYNRNRPEAESVTDVTVSGVTDKSVTLTQAMIDDLPACVVKPTAQPGNDGSLPTTGWRHTKTYAQTIYDLLTMSIAELKEQGQWIPTWKYAREAA